ncbi:MAG: Zn-ribbon domain-containing OB-fold protein [Anaerolineales bacterium]
MSTITAYKCSNCGYVNYPRHERCLNCGQRDFKEINPTKKGKLLTYTIVNELPWGIDERGRVIGVVEFDNGIRAMGLIKADKLKLGMKLTAGWEQVRFMNGEKVYGLTFS